MRCSVVIPCHDGAALTRRCVLSLLGQRGVDDLEILLVDNASSDETPELTALDPRVRCLRQAENLGFAGGVNVGLRAASRPWIVVLNNDTQAAGNLLQELHRALVSGPRIGAAAPVSNFVKGPAQLAIGAGASAPEIREAIAAELDATEHGRVQDVATLAGLCLMMHRTTIDEVGLFDERFGHGNFEDDDFCLRLRLRGYRLVIARGAFLHHEGHATFRALGIDLEAELRGRRDQFAGKWRDDPAGRAVLAELCGDLAGAGAAAAAGRERWPAWPDADWHIGRAAAAAGDHAAAAERFAALLRSCPRHSDAALELAICRLRGGDPEAAGEQLAWAAAHCHLPATALAGALRRIGEHLCAQGSWSAAADSFRDALALLPEDGDLHNRLGSCQLELGALDAASASFRAAARHDQPLAHTNLGICELRRGRRDAARRHFETACELLPDDPVARANLRAFRATKLRVCAGFSRISPASPSI